MRLTKLAPRPRLAHPAVACGVICDFVANVFGGGTTISLIAEPRAGGTFFRPQSLALIHHRPGVRLAPAIRVIMGSSGSRGLWKRIVRLIRVTQAIKYATIKRTITIARLMPRT